MTQGEVERALVDIQEIRRMIEHTRRATMESGGLFVWWGVLSIVATGLTYHFNSLERYEAIGMTWMTFTALGYAGTFLHVRKRRRTGIRTYIDQLVGATWIGCGVAMLIFAFIAPAVGAYRWSMISSMVTIILGIGVFIMGALHRWRVLYGVAALWWCGGIVMMVYEEAALLLMGILVGGVMVLIGLIARTRTREGGAPTTESYQPSAASNG